MLLLSFALSIAIYTIWLNAKLGILISLVMFAGVVVITPFCTASRSAVLRDGKGGLRGIFQRKKRLKRYASFLLGNLVALTAVSVHLWWKDVVFLETFWGQDERDSQEILSSFEKSSLPLFPEVLTGYSTKGGGERGKWQTFNGFGTITDTQKYHVYLFTDETGRVWRLSSSQTYHIGDQLFLSASIKPWEKEVIFDETFVPPRKVEFWEYQFNYDKWIFMKGIDGTAYEKQALLVDADKP
ncbi:MAG: hypothetical protein LBU27_04525 [Candidatus Peribacteria bacterium]|jgi:hypothetical protein|nr:hypothetical protein [Candidatus Peribacteria bacterium]